MHGLMATGMYRLFDNSPVSMALFSLEPLKSVFLFFYPFASKLGYRKIVIKQSGDLRVCEDSIIYIHIRRRRRIFAREMAFYRVIGCGNQTSSNTAGS